MKYDIIYADPSWSFNNKKTGGNMKSGADAHYKTMSVDEMCKLPIPQIASDNCILFMWWVASQPEEAVKLTKAWGFKVKTMTGFNWVKTTKTGKLDFGMGFYSRCLHPSTNVYCTNIDNKVERITLYTLLNNKDNYSKIWTFNGWKNILNIWESKNENCFEIKTNVSDFICSENHRWLTKIPYSPRKKGGVGRKHLHRLDWFFPSEIKTRIEKPKQQKSCSANLIYSKSKVEPKKPLANINDFKLTEDLMWLVGLYVAEGSKRIKGVRFTLHSEEFELHKKIQIIVDDLNLYSERYKTHRVTPRTYKSKVTKGVDITVNCEKLKNLILYFCKGERANSKFLNLQSILNLSSNLRESFLKGVLDGDGTKGIGYNGFSCIALSSEKLIDDVRIISESLGIPTSKFQYLSYASKIVPGRHPYWYCRFLIPKNKSIKFELRPAHPIKIDSIEKIKYNDILIDISVEGEHFVANGFVTHNSGSEMCLIATKGKPKVVNRGVRSVELAERTAHSRKPPIFRDKIVTMMGDIPRIELFAREKVNGWEAIGYDIDGLDIETKIDQL